MEKNAIQQYLECQPPDVSPSTTQQYVDELHRLNRYLMQSESIDLTRGEIERVQPSHLIQYQKMRGASVSSQSLNKYTAAMRSFFGFHTTLGTIPADPSKILHYIKRRYKAAVHPDKKKAVYYTGEQIQSILEYLGRHGTKEKLRDAALIALMSASCLRVGEACSLNISDMETIRAGYCRVMGKHGEWEKAGVAGYALGYLVPYLDTRPAVEPDSPLFLSRAGIRLTPNAAWKAFKRTQTALNLQTGTHILRHTAITFIANFVGVLAARDAARHRNLSTTNGYMHEMPDIVTKAVNENPLAGMFAKENF